MTVDRNYSAKSTPTCINIIFASDNNTCTRAVNSYLLYLIGSLSYSRSILSHEHPSNPSNPSNFYFRFTVIPRRDRYVSHAEFHLMVISVISRQRCEMVSVSQSLMASLLSKGEIYNNAWCLASWSILWRCNCVHCELYQISLTSYFY